MLSVASMVYVGDSDDSDTEGGLGNIERVVMRPPGHSGKAKRGHLCFDASFETGNLGRIDFITENEYDLFIRPDTCNPRVRFWFHFTVDNVQENQRVIFNIVNLSRTRNLFQQGMTPVVKSTSRKKCFSKATQIEPIKRCLNENYLGRKRLPSRFVFYYCSPDHSNNVVLSFAFAFDKVEGEQYDFALTFPYSYSRCRQFEEHIAKRTKYVKCEPFAKSIQNREISLLTITDNVEADITQDKKIVIVMARSHPGEPLSSYVLQGMMEFLSSEHSIAADLRGKVVFKFFPMLNPDGVYLGNSRCTLLGSDLNRCWQETSQFHHPILYEVKKYILNQNKKHPIDFVIDLHSSSSLLGIFIQGNSYDSVYRHERHSVFPKMMAQNCPDFILPQTIYNADAEKEGTARRFLGQVLAETTNVYSLEVSMHGQYDPDRKCIVPYTEEDYSLHGRRVCRAFWDYFKVMNVIDDADYKPVNIDSNESAGLGEAGFSMVRLKEIAKQREIFSSFETLSNESSDSDSDASKLSKLSRNKSDQDMSLDISSGIGTPDSRTPRRSMSRRRTNSSLTGDNTSISSSLREFIQEDPENGFRKLNFVEYRKSLRQKQMLKALQEAGSFKVVGKKIDRPDRIRRKIHSVEDVNPGLNWDGSDCLQTPPRYLLPHNLDQTQPRQILTISRVQLRRAAIDEGLFDDKEDGNNETNFWKFGDSCSLTFEKNRKKVVGGGGIIVEFGDRGPSSEKRLPLTKSPIRIMTSPKLDGSLHVDLRLDQISSFQVTNFQSSGHVPTESTKSPKREKSRGNKSKKRSNEQIKVEITTDEIPNI